MNAVLGGSVAGCLGTVPMTWTMDALHRRLPWREQYPLPPRPITENAANKAGVLPELDEQDRQRLTLASHFLMGTAAGAAYGLTGRKMPLPPVVAGACFGLVVWAANYLGILPAAGLLTPATEHPPRRNGLMIAAHLVWGAATGIIAERLAPRP